MKKGRETAVRAALAALVLAYMAFAANWFFLSERTAANESSLRTGRTPALIVWHVVSFKPPSGSLSSVVAGRASAIEKKHTGVYYEIIAMDIKEYSLRSQRGDCPDVLSFPSGLRDPNGLIVLEGDEGMPESVGRSGEWDNAKLAIPYAAGSYALLVNETLARKAGFTLEESALTQERFATSVTGAANALKGAAMDCATMSGDALAAAMWGSAPSAAPDEAFIEGKALMLMCDGYGAASYGRKAAENGMAVSQYPLGGGWNSLVQYIAVSSATDERKLPYALELVAQMTGEAAAEAIVALGLIPAGAVPEGMELPNTFLFERYMDELIEKADLFAAGDTSAQKAIEERRKELVHGG